MKVKQFKLAGAIIENVLGLVFIGGVYGLWLGAFAAAKQLGVAWTGARVNYAVAKDAYDKAA